ncbi:MAG TPA: hypothetical protein PKE47_02160, partial [Verrucomicrobiota bacterium]|nr:hypothetical protein [Verrucomicrobiota bacterium]
MFPGEELWLPFARAVRRLIPVRRRQTDELTVGGERVVLRYVRHPRARRYVLRLARDSSARVTVPRGGSLAEARAFAVSKSAWLAGQLLRQRQARARRTPRAPPSHADTYPRRGIADSAPA